MPPPEFSRRTPEAPLDASTGFGDVVVCSSVSQRLSTCSIEVASLGDRDEAPGDAPLHILQSLVKIAIERSHAGMERASVVFAPKRFGDE